MVEEKEKEIRFDLRPKEFILNGDGCLLFLTPLRCFLFLTSVPP